MSSKTVTVSDVSGQEIVPGNAARVTISLDRLPDVRFILEVDESEITPLVNAGRTEKKRGRKPKVAA